MRNFRKEIDNTRTKPGKASVSWKEFGWGLDGHGNKHMTLNGRDVLFVVKASECMIDAIDQYLAQNSENVSNAA